MSTRHLPRLVTLATLAVAATAAVPAVAGADSIAYVKDGNAWLTTPDGGRQVQVTRTGDVHFVSQADDGTMIALVGGERLRKIGRDGRTQAEFATYVSDGAPVSGPTNRFHGPFAPQISPDGTKVAFEWFNDTYTNGAGCDAVNGCYLHRGTQGVGITRSDGFTGHEAFGILTGWHGPRWLDDGMLMRSAAASNFVDDVVFSPVGPGIGGTQNDPWFKDDTGRGGIRDVVWSRQSGAIVGVGGSADDQLRIYRPLVEPHGAPNFDHTPFAKNEPVVEQCFERTAGKVEEPTLAPDGRAVAYATPEGIRVAPLPDLRGGCGTAPGGETLIVPGGRHADWGPADVPASIPGDRPVPAPVPAPVPGPAPDDRGVRPAPGSATRLAAHARRATLAAARRSGLTVEVAPPGRGTVAVTATVRGRRAGTTRRTVAGAGVVRLRVRLAARALRGRGARTVAVQVAFTPAGGGTPQRTTARVRLGAR